MSAPRKLSRGEPLHILQAWLSLGVGGLCALAFIATIILDSGAAGRRDAAMERATLHYREHPYLNAPLEILLEVEEDNAPTLDAEQIDGTLREREQAELDAIVAEAETAERESAAYRFGVAAGGISALRLALHAFVHAGLLHLLWNLGLLASAGARLELLVGRALFAGLLFGSAATGAALHLALAGPESAPLLGLSAVSAGFAGAFAVRPGDNASDPLALIDAKPRRSPLRAAAILGLVVLCFTVLIRASAPSFEPIGQLGGFAFGALAMFGVRRAGLIQDSAGERLSPEVARAVAQLKAGDAAGALELLRARLSGSADDPLAARALGLALRGRGDAREELERALFAAIAANRRGVASALWRELAAFGATATGRTAQLQTLATWLRAAGAPGEARAALMAALSAADAAVATKIAREARRADPVLALRAAERALSFGTLREAERKALEELVAQMRKDALSAGVVMLDAAREAAAATEREARAPRAVATPLDARRGADPALIAGDDGALDLTDSEPEAPEPLTPELTQSEEEAAPQADPSADHQHFFERGAIDLAAPEPSIELPDPEIAGDAALLDALHDALAADGGDLSGDLVEPEAPAPAAPVTPAASAPDLRARADAAREQKLPPRADEFAFGATEADDDSLFEEEKPEPAAPRLRALKVSAATPLRLDDGALVLDIEGRGRGKLAFAKIDAVSAAGVRGISQNGKAVLLIDLAIGFAAGEGDLRVVRLRADAFDPRTLVEGQTSPLAALRALVAELRARTRAVALPRETEASAPFRIYADLASYEREALGAAAATSAP